MATTAEAIHEHDHHEQSFVTKYIFSYDHKMIGKQFLIMAIFMGIVGGMLSIFFRIQLAWPEQSSDFLNLFLGDRWAPEGILNQDMFLGLVTLHGTIMVFFVLTGGLSGTFSNSLIPLQIGARDMASGFINMMSAWLYNISAVIMLASLFVESGPAMSGWTVYPPLSALPQAVSGSGLGMSLWMISLIIFVASSLLGSLNYVVTIVNMRTKGMTFTRLPLTIWAFLITAIVGIISFPVLFAAVLLLAMDRTLGTSFYLSDIIVGGEMLDHVGGSPILYEHLFWFLGHPEVYIVLLPSLGITSEIISTMSRKPIFGYRAMIGSLLAIGFLSCLVWAHHMFVSGMDPFLASVFTFTTLLIAVPSAIKVFNYLTTLWKGSIIFTPAMLFSIGLVSTFISGGITGTVLGNASLDIQVHDTMFVVAHFHVVMGLSSIFGMFAGIYHWFPKLYGRMMNDKLGYIHFWTTIIAGYGVFLPMHFIGLGGAPRRYYDYSIYDTWNPLASEMVLDLNQIITFFAILGSIGQLFFIVNFFYSIFKGPKAPLNPWKSNTLEWTTPTAVPGHGNWPGEIPEVHRWPYDYSKPGWEEDYVPQTVPLREGEVDGGGH